MKEVVVAGVFRECITGLTWGFLARMDDLGIIFFVVLECFLPPLFKFKLRSFTVFEDCSS